MIVDLARVNTIKSLHSTTSVASDVTTEKKLTYSVEWFVYTLYNPATLSGAGNTHALYQCSIHCGLIVAIGSIVRCVACKMMSSFPWEVG